MSQGSLNTPTTGPVSPTTFAADINTALDAIISKNSGASAPTNFPTTGGTSTQFQEWMDTTVGTAVKAKLYDGAAFVYTGTVDTTNHFWVPKICAGTTQTLFSLVANTNDWAPDHSTANRLPLTATPAINITGIVAGEDGDIILVDVQAGSSAVTFTAADANSAAANRFVMPRSMTIRASQTIAFQYSTINSGWRPMTTMPDSAMTIQNLTSGSGATYTTPAGSVRLRIRMIGGGGGGGGSGSPSTNGGTGGTTTFNAITAIGGTGGLSNQAGTTPGSGGAGGTGGAGSAAFRVPGGSGGAGGATTATTALGWGGGGGNGPFGGGAGMGTGGGTGGAGATNSGGGGGAAGSQANNIAGGGGGGAGEYAEILINNPAATYTYTVGAAGTAGAANNNGGAGAVGRIVVEEFYS